MHLNGRGWNDWPVKAEYVSFAITPTESAEMPSVRPSTSTPASAAKECVEIVNDVIAQKYYTLLNQPELEKRRNGHLVSVTSYEVIGLNGGLGYVSDHDPGKSLREAGQLPWN